MSYLFRHPLLMILLGLALLVFLAWLSPEGVDHGVKMFLFNEGMGPFPLYE